MNEVEAIERLRREVALLIALDTTNTSELANAMTIASNALEKQIPKKPHGVDGFHNSEHCEICEKELYEKYNYCPECGQALDWSEDDE